MTSRPQRRRWLLGCFSLLCASTCCAMDVPRSPATLRVSSDTSASVEERKLELEIKKFEFEKNEKLDFEKKKFSEEMDHKRLDSSRENRKMWVEFCGVAVPLLVAIIGVWVETYKRRVEESAQRISQEESEKLQFQLKAAEIAFDVRNSREIQPKAAALAQLFPERLPKDFAKNLDPDTIRFGPPATEAKLELLKLLAQYPNQRTVILRTWGHMFPLDTGKWKASEHPNYAWFDGVLNDPSINANAGD